MHPKGRLEWKKIRSNKHSPAGRNRLRLSNPSPVHPRSQRGLHPDSDVRHCIGAPVGSGRDSNEIPRARSGRHEDSILPIHSTHSTQNTIGFVSSTSDNGPAGGRMASFPHFRRPTGADDWSSFPDNDYWRYDAIDWPRSSLALFARFSRGRHAVELLFVARPGSILRTISPPRTIGAAAPIHSARTTDKLCQFPEFGIVGHFASFYRFFDRLISTPHVISELY